MVYKTMCYMLEHITHGFVVDTLNKTEVSNLMELKF